MTVGVEVTVDGSAPAARVRVLSVRVASRLSQPTQCEVALDPGDDGWEGTWPLGARLTVRAEGHDDPLFDGEVTGVELARGPDGATVHRLRGYDLVHRLRRRGQVRVFENVTVADLAEELTSGHGIRVEADGRGPRLERLVQHRQDDLELLVGVAARVGLYTAMHGATLRLVDLDGHGDPVTLHYGRSLWEVAVESTLDRPAAECTAYGWHPQRAEPIVERAGSPRTGRQVRLDPAPGDVGADGARILVDQPGRGAEELAAAAQATVDVGAGRALTVRGVAQGDPLLRAGCRIDLRGVGAQVDGRYALTEAVHTIDTAGWLTRVSTCPPVVAAAEPVAATTVTLGRVTGVADPEALGRVRVSLPAYGDPDAGWLGVLCPGAGQGRGLVVLPDVGDTVLVALPHGIPAEGIVLGSLYGGVAPPDSGVDGDAVLRWSLRTADGQSVVVDDAEHSIRLRDRAGSIVELTPALVRLHAATDLTVEAPGHAITMRADTIDFVRASAPEEA